MKTAILSFSVRNSSLSEFFIRIANGLSENYQVIIVTDCIQPHPFHISPAVILIRRPSSGSHSIRTWNFLISLIRKKKPSILIGNFSAVSSFMIIGCLFGVKTRIAWCHSISQQFVEKRPFLDKKRLVYALATKIFANSRSTKEDLIKNFRIKSGKIEIFYNAIKRPVVDIKPEASLQITYAGRLDESKGVKTLLQAMPFVIHHNPDIILKIIGGHPNSEQITKWKELVKKLDLDPHVVFLSFQPRKIVLEEYAKSYLAVVPSIVEAFGYVVIESFSVKTPVVGSSTTGISEIIRDGIDGFLFEPGNSEDLAAKIIKLIDEPTLREKFSLNCFARFEENFELSKVALGIVKRIENLNSGSSG